MKKNSDENSQHRKKLKSFDAPGEVSEPQFAHKQDYSSADTIPQTANLFKAEKISPIDFCIYKQKPVY